MIPWNTLFHIDKTVKKKKKHIYEMHHGSSIMHKVNIKKQTQSEQN